MLSIFGHQRELPEAPPKEKPKTALESLVKILWGIDAKDAEIRSLRLRSKLALARLEGIVGDDQDADVLSNNAENRIFREIERVRKEVLEIGRKIDHLKDNDITEMKVEIAMLKVKAGVWGLLGGLVPISVAVLVQFLKNMLQ